MNALLWVLLAQAGWDAKTPEAAGLSRDRLVALGTLAGGRGCVVRGGALVHSWGDVTRSVDVRSAAAPLFGTLALRAVQEGLLPGTDGAQADLDLARVFARPVSDVIRDRIAAPLGFEDDWEYREGRWSVSVRDFARFGLAILRGGARGERRILDSPLAYLSISSPSAGRSYGWWLNGIDEQRRQLFVDGPGDLVAALGDGGKHALWILPSLDLVVSWSDAVVGDLELSPGNREAALNRAVRLLVESAK